MEELIICPNCKNIINNDICNNCNYVSDNDNVLIEILYSEYNKAIELLQQGNIINAWIKMKDVIILYPFKLIPLKFCFYLSIEVGEYQKSAVYLSQLKFFLTNEEINNLSTLLSNHVSEYNLILEKNTTNFTFDQLSFILQYMLYLKKNKNFNSNWIENNLQKNNIYINNSGRFAKYSFIWAILISLLSITFIIIIVINKNVTNTLEKNNENKRMLILNLNKENKNLQAKIKKQSELNQILSIFLTQMKKQDYKSCSKLLITNPALIQHIVSLNQSYIIENLCNNLYFKGEYATIIMIDFEAERTPHAYFRYKVLNSNNRITAIENFVKKYPLYKWYTAPLLKELFDYYKDINTTKALNYAFLLKQYVEIHPEDIYKVYFTNTVQKYFITGENK